MDLLSASWVSSGISWFLNTILELYLYSLSTSMTHRIHQVNCASTLRVRPGKAPWGSLESPTSPRATGWASSWTSRLGSPWGMSQMDQWFIMVHHHVNAILFFHFLFFLGGGVTIIMIIELSGFNRIWIGFDGIYWYLIGYKQQHYMLVCPDFLVYLSKWNILIGQMLINQQN